MQDMIKHTVLRCTCICDRRRDSGKWLRFVRFPGHLETRLPASSNLKVFYKLAQKKRIVRSLAFLFPAANNPLQNIIV